MWKYNESSSSDELYHHGILGQKWGVRRYQNEDGSLTAEGRARYGRTGEILDKAEDIAEAKLTKYSVRMLSNKKNFDENGKLTIEAAKKWKEKVVNKINENISFTTLTTTYHGPEFGYSYRTEFHQLTSDKDKSDETHTLPVYARAGGGSDIVYYNIGDDGRKTLDRIKKKQSSSNKLLKKIGDIEKALYNGIESSSQYDNDKIIKYINTEYDSLIKTLNDGSEKGQLIKKTMDEIVSVFPDYDDERRN